MSSASPADAGVPAAQAVTSTDRDRPHLQLIRDLEFRPTFIIGDHRSGTTLLYQLLAKTGAFDVLTAYHVIRYDELLANHLAGCTAEAEAELAAGFARHGLADRVIDGVRVSPDLPEEYGFIIDRSSTPQLRPATLARFVELCQKLRFIGRDRPILLKNPWDVLRFAYIHQTLPHAKFIFIHRHPLHVMSSQLEATRALFSERNEYVALLSPWYRQLFDHPVRLGLTRAITTRRLGIGARVTGRHVAKVAGYHLAHLDRVPPGDRAELRYEDVCADPDGVIGRVLDFLRVEPACAPDLRALVRPRARPVLPEIASEYRRIRPKLAAYCERYGYPEQPQG